MILIALLGILIFGLHGCGGGGSSTQSPASAPPSPPEDAPVWTQIDTLGFCCHYTPIIFDGGALRVYSNTGSAGDGVWHLDGVPVLRIADPRDAYIRTSAVQRDQRGYFALLYTGACYGAGCPGGNGFSPSWATSPDGRTNWTWHGPVSPYGRYQASAAAMVIEADGSFTAWTDNANAKLRRSTSHEGIHWIADAADSWPAELSGDDPQFPSATRTPFGYHAIVANRWPATAHRHLWSCTGKTWRVLEMSAPTLSEKGANLTYADGMIYALSAGKLWSTPARGWTC